MIIKESVDISIKDEKNLNLQSIILNKRKNYI